MLMKILFSFTVWSNFFQTTPINPEENYLERYYYHKANLIPLTTHIHVHVHSIGWIGTGTSKLEAPRSL
jgi:hypothetical protein